MKTATNAIALLVSICLGAFTSLGDITTGWIQTTWADKIANAHDFFNTDNWDGGIITGEFGSGLGSAKTTQIIKFGADWSQAFSFTHSNEANLTFVGDGTRDATWFVAADMLFTPPTTKGMITFGNGDANRKFLINLGGARRKFRLDGTNGYVFMNGISNGDLLVDSSAPTVALRYSDAKVDGDLEFYGTKLQFDSSKDGEAGAVRAKDVVFYGQELEIRGNKTVYAHERIDGDLTVDGSRGALKLLSVIAGTAGTSFTADSLSVENGALLGVRGAGLGDTPGAGVANVFFETAPALIGGTGGAECPVIPFVIASPTYGDNSILGYAYDTSLATYDTATGVRPLNFSTEYVTSQESITTGRENFLVPHGASTVIDGDVSVNSVVLRGGDGTTPSTLSGGEGSILRVTSGQIVVGYQRNAAPTISVPVDFGNRHGSISYAAGKNTHWNSPISGNQGLSLTWFYRTVSGNAGITMSGDSDYTGDTYINGNVFIGVNSRVLPCGERSGNVYVRGALGFNGDSKTSVQYRINGLYGDGTIKRSTYTINLDIGDNDASGDFSGVLQDFSDVTKIGTGTQRFGGTVTLASNGNFNVNAGKVVLDGTVTQGAVNVAAGAAIGGSGSIATTLAFTDGAKLLVKIANGVASCLSVAGTVSGGTVTVDADVAGGKWTEPQCILRSGNAITETFAKGAGVGALELRENGTELWATPRKAGFYVVIQ